MSKNSGIGSCAFWSAGFKGFAVLVCFTGFMLQSYEIFIEFTNGHSSIGIEYNVATRIALPQITICPAKTVKYPIDKRTATKEEFMRATYGMDELILPYEDNVTAWKFKTEIHAPIPGRCFVFENNEVLDSLNITQFLRLNGNHTLQLYAHLSGDEFWHWMLLSPMQIPALTIKVPVEGLTSMDLHVNKKQTNVLKRGGNCEEYAMPEDFTKCAKKAIEREVLKKATCVSHLSRPIIPNGDLPECSSEEEMIQNNEDVQNGIVGFVVNPSQQGCPLPCKYVHFNIRANYFDEIETNPIPGGLKMYTYFDTMVVETQNEILIYNWPKFLSAIGGTLGLYLGFSCLSSFFYIVKSVDLFQTYRKGRVKDIRIDN